VLINFAERDSLRIFANEIMRRFRAGLMTEHLEGSYPNLKNFEKNKQGIMN
jgi:hypothetical protein